MNDNIISAFPFELALNDTGDGQELFIKTVEQILKENLQSKKAFGCNIDNCHMHIGSKIHTNEFVEAELLFHNSYYNSHFAWLTQQFIQNKTKDKSYSSIILVGYETFGELYLLECQELLEKTAHCPVYYCVAEAKGGNVKIRSTIPDEAVKPEQKPYFVFIVPISTTLTTHDKLMAAYRIHLNAKLPGEKLPGEKPKFDDKNSINLALIVIGTTEDKNDYWKEGPIDEDDKKTRSLILAEAKQNLLTELGKRKVFYFVRHDLDWEKPKNCINCYPDLNEELKKKLKRALKKNQKKSNILVHETPVFEVSKESIVPVLQIGIEDIPIPLNIKLEEDDDIRKYKDACDNIRKVIHLSSFMYAKHIIRNGNHYQYYINTQSYNESLKDKTHRPFLDSWEERIRESLKNEDESCAIYDFIVAPRHFSNAGFVHEVSTRIFKESARVLYIDVNKEYRKNLVAKYSDFSAQIRKIAESKQDYKIRFHFVDDMIITGASFQRSKNLVQSLINGIEAKNKDNIQLFSSIIVLVDRNSDESRKQYIDDVNMFFPYVYVSISSLRNQENSCILCGLRKSYKILKREAAFKETTEKFKALSKKYKLTDCQNLKPEFLAKNPDRLLMIVGHILEERLSNRWLYIKDSKLEKTAITQEDSNINGIDREDEVQVLRVLKLYYKELNRFIGLYTEEKFSKDDVEIAMIKIISRPYFTNHIRCRQASFKFCIEKMAEYQELSKEKPLQRIKTKHIKALINALSDMNANYLFRRNNMVEFLDITSLQKNYIWAVKKEISLSNDDNKSVLLEHSLVKGNEDWLFESEPVDDSKEQEPVDDSKEQEPEDDSKERKLEDDSKESIIHQKSWMELYFENNRVLKSSLKKMRDVKKFEVNEYPYYLNSFYEIMKIQGINDQNIELLNKYIHAFLMLYDAIDKQKKGKSDIQHVAKWITKLLCCDPEHDYGAVYVIVKDGKHSSEGINRWDRYAILAKNKKGSDIKFYNNTNLEILDLLTEAKDEKVTSVMKTISYFKKDSEKVSKSKFKNVNTTVINLYEEKNVQVYVQIDESIDKATSSLDEIQANTLHFLLPLKLLLCLRYEISRYMKKCNVLSHLQAKRYRDITNALSIRKATKHQDLGINEGNIPHQMMLAIYSEAKRSDGSNLDGIIDQVKDNFYDNNAKFPDSFIEAYGAVANKYMQYLANEYISSFYRQMVRESSTYNNENSAIQDKGYWIDYMHLDRVRNYLCKMGFEENKERSELNTVIFVPNDGYKNTHAIVGEQETRITIHTQNFTDDRVIWTRKEGLGAVTAFYYLLILSLSMNAGKHFNTKKGDKLPCVVDVEIEDEYLVVKNNMIGVTDENREKYESIAIQRMITPPWFFKAESQSITLWTLNTFMEIFQKQDEIKKSIPDTGNGKKWINIGINKNDSNGTFYFEIKLRIIGNE